jgi:hypothetical protein
MLIAMLVLSPSTFKPFDRTLFCRTFNAAYFVSIIVGLGVGEVIFGRWASNSYH